MLYRTQVTQIGEFATESLNENMMISSMTMHQRMSLTIASFIQMPS